MSSESELEAAVGASSDGRGYGRPVGSFDEELVRVGPGTPCGELMRRYWHPVATTAELRDLPVAVRLLGEDLVLFRDLTGRPGLVESRCCHRGTTLFYGRVEEDGIRCCYHGWLFDVEGRCLDQPCEPNGGLHRERYRQPWYPVEERYGLIFAYLGPGDDQPPLPRYDLLESDEPGFEIFVDGGVPLHINSRDPNPVEINWLQKVENTMDPFHVYILHNNMSREQFSSFFTVRPDVTWEYTDRGMKTIADRPTDDGDRVLRINELYFPNISVVGDPKAAAFDRSVIFAFAVPLDDVTVKEYFLLRFRSATVETFNDGSFARAMTGKAWDEMNEREHQESPWDYEAQVGQGTITLHSDEHLASSDRGVTMFRALLRRNIRSVAEGRLLTGVDPKDRETLVEVTAGNYRVAGRG